MPRSDRLSRRRPSKTPRPSYLIVCEGKVTETCYFDDLRRLDKIPIELKIRSGATPRTLVEWAVEEKNRADRQAKRDRDPFLKFDEVWVVFDIDEHPHIAEAKQQARDNGIKLAISNPCFELWALLHFQEQFAFIERHEVRRLCRGYMPGYAKKLPADRLLPRYADALRRATHLDQWHQPRGTSGQNPSTAVHQLVESIRKRRENWCLE